MERDEVSPNSSAALNSADISLQRHARNNQGSIFLHLHLWMHTILVSFLV